VSKLPTYLLYAVRELPNGDQQYRSLRVDEMAGYVSIEVAQDGDWDEVANCTRFSRAQGASFSGWVVRDRRGDCTDPIDNKHDAMRNLAYMVEDVLKARVVYGRDELRLIDRYAPIDADL
jgi:hypothetical protein